MLKVLGKGIIFSIVVLSASCTHLNLQNMRHATLTKEAASQELAAGIKYYRKGSYDKAYAHLRSALNVVWSGPVQVQAHKYLAFIDCFSKRTNECRAEFEQALKLDPNFHLRPAEAGHPMWGPVFRSVKAQQQKKG